MAECNRQTVALQYQLTEADFADFLVEVWRSDPELIERQKRLKSLRMWLGLAAVATMVAAAGVLLVPANLTGEGRAAVAVSMMLVLGCWLVALGVLSFVDVGRGLRYKALLAARQPEHQASLGDWRITADAEAITIESPGGAARRRWWNVGKARATAAAAIIERPGAVLAVVPRRVFGEAMACEEFAERCERWREAFADLDRENILSQLASRDMPCPACEYNLRGVSVCACPECGLALTRWSLPDLLPE